MSETSPLDGMPLPIISMLRDEANLSTARHVLDDARNDCISRLETLKSQRPAFGFLSGKKQKEEHAAAVASVESQLGGIDRMVDRVNAARDRLQPGLRAGLVGYLNQADPMYAQGLKASRFHEHWRRNHLVVADRLKAFIRDTREVRNAVTKDAESGRPRFSGDTVWRLTNARNAGIELDREIETLNQVASDQHNFVAPTPFSLVRLPVLEKWNCMKRVDTLMLRTPTEAAFEADQLLAEFVELRQHSLTTIKDIFEAVAAEHAQLAEARLRQCWSSLLTYAEAHLVTDAELEPILNDIELRQTQVERERILDQVKRPFDIER